VLLHEQLLGESRDARLLNVVRERKSASWIALASPWHDQITFAPRGP